MKRFTAPDGYDVWVNLGAVEMVHAVRLVHSGAPPNSGTKIIFVSGGFQFVREPVDEVLKVLEDAGR